MIHIVNQKSDEVLFYVLIAGIGISLVLYLSLSIERSCSLTSHLWYRIHITTRVCWYSLCAIWTGHIIFKILVSCLLPLTMDYENIIIK